MDSHAKCSLSRVADNALEILGLVNVNDPTYGSSFLPAANVAQLAIKRWMHPRSLRDDSYKSVTREDILRQIGSGSASLERASEFQRAQCNR